MTALAGLWSFDGRPDVSRRCADMLAAQAIYGPHDQAQWDMGAIAIGRRLFRLLPEDIHDQGPVLGGDGRFAMVADIRLDNRDELIAALAPRNPAELPDAALLMAAWERWQENLFDHLVGDYAFALFDKAAQKLLLARDGMSAKPLHYHRGEGFIAFASMPKGLHRLAEIPRQPDEDRVAELLALLPEAGTETYFKAIERVEPGCVAIVTRDGVTTRRHWQPASRNLGLKGTEAYVEGLLFHFDQAVRSCLRGAGTAVGSHLSSGFDSTAVATGAARQIAPGRVVAFTSVPREGFDGKTPWHRHGDEGPVAAKTAAMYPNMEHVLIRTEDRTPLDDLDRIFFLYERPILNLCNGVWMHAINDAARARKLTVMLTGQMGNMTISYDGHTLLPKLVAGGRLLRWSREAVGLLRRRNLRPRSVLALSFGPFMPAMLWRGINRAVRGVSSDVDSYSALRPNRLEELDIATLAEERNLDLDYRPRRDSFDTRLWVMRRMDLGNMVKGTLGGWGFDTRDPTADRRLIEFCLSIPDEECLMDGETKALARRAFADRMPPEVIGMRGKGYQAADWYENLERARGALGEEIARLGECDPAATALDLPRMKALLDNWPEGGWETPRVMQAYRLALLRGIASGHFLRRASGSNA